MPLTVWAAKAPTRGTSLLARLSHSRRSKEEQELEQQQQLEWRPRPSSTGSVLRPLMDHPHRGRMSTLASGPTYSGQGSTLLAGVRRASLTPDAQDQRGSLRPLALAGGGGSGGWRSRAASSASGGATSRLSPSIIGVRHASRASVGGLVQLVTEQLAPLDDAVPGQVPGPAPRQEVAPLPADDGMGPFAQLARRLTVAQAPAGPPRLPPPAEGRGLHGLGEAGEPKAEAGSIPLPSLLPAAHAADPGGALRAARLAPVTATVSTVLHAHRMSSSGKLGERSSASCSQVGGRTSTEDGAVTNAGASPAPWNPLVALIPALRPAPCASGGSAGGLDAGGDGAGWEAGRGRGSGSDARGGGGPLQPGGEPVQGGRTTSTRSREAPLRSRSRLCNSVTNSFRRHSSSGGGEAPGELTAGDDEAGQQQQDEEDGPAARQQQEQDSDAELQELMKKLMARIA